MTYIYNGTTKNEPTVYLKRTLVNGKWLAPCGTRSAHARHIRWGEEPCNRCKDAQAAARAKLRGHHHTPGRRRRKQAICGTTGGRQRHIRLGERVCFDCSEAHRIAQAKYDQRKKEKP